MRKSMLMAAVAFVVGGAACGALLANAQPAAPPSVVLERAPAGPMQMHRGPDMGRRGPEPGTFALVYRETDRQLSPSDVGKIAEAFLLWQGNHAWKITDLAATPHGPVAFSVATPEGSVIARFTMDPHTGRVTRTG